MDRLIIRVLSWGMFFGVFLLTLNHILRGLEWWPLSALFIPTSLMVYIMEVRDED